MTSLHIIIAAWAGANLAFLTAFWLHGRRRQRADNSLIDSLIHDKARLNEEVADFESDALRAAGSLRAARGELTGYRSAVGDLTANPTTIIIDPYRKAARDGEAAPV